MEPRSGYFGTSPYIPQRTQESEPQEKIRVLIESQFPKKEVWLKIFYQTFYDSYHTQCKRYKYPKSFSVDTEYSLECFPSGHVWIVFNPKLFPEIVLGVGASKVVVKIWNLTTGNMAAFHVQSKNSESCQWENEIKFLGKLKHCEFINAPMSIYKTSGLYRMISPYIECDLFEYLQKKPDRFFCKDIIRCFLEAVGYLHRNRIVHKDLKLENVLVEIRGEQVTKVKIIDFGYSCFRDERHKLQKPNGTCAYFAPETVVCKKYGFASDVYAAGITCQVVLTGRFLPWMPLLEEKRDFPALVKMHKFSRRKTTNKKSLRYIFREMLCYYPEKRITIREALQKLNDLKPTRVPKLSA